MPSCSTIGAFKPRFLISRNDVLRRHLSGRSPTRKLIERNRAVDGAALAFAQKPEMTGGFLHRLFAQRRWRRYRRWRNQEGLASMQFQRIVGVIEFLQVADANVVQLCDGCER